MGLVGSYRGHILTAGSGSVRIWEEDTSEQCLPCSVWDAPRTFLTCKCRWEQMDLQAAPTLSDLLTPPCSNTQLESTASPHAQGYQRAVPGI